MPKNVFAFFCCIICGLQLQAQSVSVNKDATPADKSAILDIAATDKGLLIPRLTTSQRNGISLPATALLIFNSDTKQFQVNTGTPSNPVWQNIVSAGSAWSTTGNTNTDGASFMGTSDEHPLRLKTNNVVRLYIDSSNTRVGIGTVEPRTSLDVVATDAIIVPAGTTAQRPSSPVVGMMRFNKTTGKLEGYTSTGWVALH